MRPRRAWRGSTGQSLHACEWTCTESATLAESLAVAPSDSDWLGVDATGNTLNTVRGDGATRMDGSNRSRFELIARPRHDWARLVGVDIDESIETRELERRVRVAMRERQTDRQAAVLLYKSLCGKFHGSFPSATAMNSSRAASAKKITARWEDEERCGWEGSAMSATDLSADADSSQRVVAGEVALPADRRAGLKASAVVGRLTENRKEETRQKKKCQQWRAAMRE